MQRLPTDYGAIVPGAMGGIGSAFENGACSGGRLRVSMAIRSIPH